MSFAEKFSSKAKGGSMVAQILRDRARICDIRLDQPNGERSYFILEVDHGKTKELSEALTLPKPLDLRDYGTILHSGWGEPPESLKAELREKYGLYQD
jgi:hypothetical protein